MSHILKKLNRLYRPLCDDFQVCILNDGMIWFKNIARKMQKVIDVQYNSKTYGMNSRTDKDILQRKYNIQEAVETLFYNDIETQSKTWREQQFRRFVYPKEMSEKTKLEAEYEGDETLEREFRNGCLVIIPCRIGMDKVESCYIQPIRYIFSQPNIFVGAMGGRPDAALYFVGLQNDELIFLDPHLV